jgi:SAM-dependent methyltransferase
MHDPARDAHNQSQREYFEQVERARIQLARSPYVQHHVRRMVDGADLRTGQSILEIGAGLGKFTLPLLEEGLRVTANDLSPRLLERLRAAAGAPVETVACDVHEIEAHAPGPFDRVVGFFVLHHLVELEAVFAGVARVLKPGGRVAFIEPVGWNPLYYVQILLTPSMRFAGEPSLPQMRPGVILPAMARAGLVDGARAGYGWFPPFVRNRAAGAALEDWLQERRRWVPFPHAFQLFTARRPA